MIRVLTALLLTLACGTAMAADQTYRFYGYAYDLASNKYIYTEVHEQKVSGDRWLGGSIRTYAPDGKAIGTKQLDFSKNPYIPVYKLDLPAQKYSEAITSVGDRIVMTKTSEGKTSSKTVARKDPMAADSGFHSLIVDRFAELMNSKPQQFNFAVAGNLDTYKFRIKRIADGTFDGKPDVRFLVEADSLLRLVAPALELSYEPQTKKLLEYRGISNIHDPATGKPYNARIAFYDQPPADAPKPLPPLE